jgi:hypothetical protein
MNVIRKVLAFTTLFIFLMSMGSVSPYTITHKPLKAHIVIKPEILNLQSHDRLITFHLESPEGCSVSDIKPASVIISHLGSHLVNIKSESYKMTENRDGDSELMMKYRSSEFISAIVGNNIENPVKVRVNGRLYDNTPFVSSATIKLLNPPKSEDQGTGGLLFFLCLLNSSTH